MDNDKIFADAGEQATLRYGNTAVDCLTLQEAVLEFMRLPDESKTQATISVSSGTVYDALQIDRLHVGSQKPAT